MNSTQSALLGVKVLEHEAIEAKKRQGKRNDLRNVPELFSECDAANEAREIVAKKLNTNSRYIQDAANLHKAVKESPDKLDILEAAEQGKINMSQAKELSSSDIPKEVREEIYESTEPKHKAIKEKKREIRSKKDDSDWTQSELERKELVLSGKAVLSNSHTGIDTHLIEWAKASNLFVKIDRNTNFGNPFIEVADGTRDEICELYEKYVPLKKSIRENLSSLKGKVLGCWCYPERCHGEHLISKLD